MARIAIVTGATGGIGKKFVEQICLMEDIDEVWSVGRNKDKLAKLKADNAKAVIVEADLSDDGVSVIENLIKENSPDIRMLVNNAGTGYIGALDKMSKEEIARICRVNCSAPSELIAIALPFMREGAKIINVSSASSFQPNPYLTMYSASKVYLRNFSRALNVELKQRDITVTCICPGWVDTGMLPKTKNGKEIKYSGMISADKVVTKALKDCLRGKDMSVPGFFANYFRFYSKITPTNLVMRQWVAGIRKYL